MSHCPRLLSLRVGDAGWLGWCQPELTTTSGERDDLAPIHLVAGCFKRQVVERWFLKYSSESTHRLVLSPTVYDFKSSYIKVKIHASKLK